MNSIVGYWRNFSALAERVDRTSPFDPLSYPFYFTLLAAILVELAVIRFAGLTYSPTAFLHAFYALIGFAGLALIARAYGLNRAAMLFDAMALPGMAGAATGVGANLAIRMAGPPVDDMLAGIDASLGLDWMVLFHFYQRHPWVVEASNFAYRSMAIQVLAIPVLLAVTGNRRRMWMFLTAWAITAIVTVAAFPFFPAASAIPHFGVRPDDLPALNILWPWKVGPMIAGLHDGSIRDLARVEVGLVTFPSFHACVAVMLAWAGWRLPVIRWPILLLNVAMILSTPIRGSHYFIDVIGGCLLGATAIFIARWLMSPAPVRI